MNIDKRVVPEELIVGIKGDLCYVTFMQGKKMNSEASWRGWSSNSDNPLKVSNKFSTGFKIGGVNSRYSRQASNSENLLITHPLFNKSFELSLSRFTELAQSITIINGVIQEELIMDYSRDILTYEDLAKQILVEDQKDVVKAERKATAALSKVKGKDQVPGKLYKEVSSGESIIYLGTALIDGVVKHIYEKPYSDEVVDAYITKDIKGFIGQDYTTFGDISFPYLVNGYVNTDHLKLGTNLQPLAFFHTKSVNCSKSKKSLFSHDLDINIFDEYSDEDWKIVEDTYNKHKALKNKFSYNSNWSKAKEDHHINFREDYLSWT